MADKSLDFENYRTYEGQPGETTESEFQEYHSNQNKLVTELTEQFLWQPLTAYAVGDIVHSKSIEGGKVARCTQAGTTGQTEPQWSATVTDGTCKWELVAESMTATQRAALDSGITASKVAQYDGYGTSKQNVLSTTQMNAVNSGITAAKIASIDSNISTLGSSKVPTSRKINGQPLTQDITINIPSGGITFDSTIAFTGSTQGNITCGIPAGIMLYDNYNYYTYTGRGAGTYSLANVLQDLINKSHTHARTTACDCYCDGG